MYWGFIIYITVIGIIMALIMSHKARMFFIAVIIFALFIYGACALQNIARAEETEEIRTCFIIGFDLSKGTFILKDEDGFLWEFSLEKDNYVLGDEYTLHLDDTPWYE